MWKFPAKEKRKENITKLLRFKHLILAELAGKPASENLTDYFYRYTCIYKSKYMDTYKYTFKRKHAWFAMIKLSWS